MTTASRAGTAIVFCCDEAYFFLARGLALSLFEAGYPNRDVRLVLIDIGCGPQTLAWLRESGVEIVAIPAGLIPASVEAVIEPVQRALAVRPYLPTLLPQFEYFVWLDSDLWVQDRAFMQVMMQGAIAAPNAIMLAPGISHHNATFYLDIDRLLQMQRRWCAACYEPQLAEQLAVRLHFSGGVFAMRRESPIWTLWAREIETLFPIVAKRDRNFLHLAEQVALTAVTYRSQNYVMLDPLYNFHCNSGGAARNDAGTVIASLLTPQREIGIVHLAAWSSLRQHYIQNRLLYRSGEYLTRAEWEHLAN